MYVNVQSIIPHGIVIQLSNNITLVKYGNKVYF